MLYLLHQQIFWLLLTALAAGVAGWAWHKWRFSARSEALDKQRAALRRELVSLVNGTADDGAEGLLREIDTLRARASLREAKIAELEQRQEELRAGREELAARLAEHQRGAIDVEPVAAPEPDHAHWRTRYLEARVRHLENLQPAETEPLALRADLDAALARNAELENAIEAAAAGGSSGDELNQLRWHARYLEARVRYLERPEPVAAADGAEDEAKRQAWRRRFLEARVAHLEGECARLNDEAEAARSRLAFADESLSAAQAALAERSQRIAELEPLEPAARQAQLLAWRARYLDARVRHLESRAPAEATAVKTVRPEDDEPAPLVPPGAEERPPALPAARFGAPDDLTLIEGVGPMQQSTLHALGVFHFDQLGAWSPANVAWVDQYLRLRGRIIDERWVEQAAALARGETARAREEA